MTATTAPKARIPELTFGARLALVRHLMGWNVKEAAAACGFPAQSWRGWEIAGHLPRRHVEIAKVIATRADVDYHWLVFGPDEGEGGGDDLTPTRQDATAPRLVATIGQPDRTVGHPTRPVRRTRPASAARPFTPTAA